MGRRALRVTVDTNVLVRAAVRDDVEQANAADRLLRTATLIAVTIPCLCEFVWVMRRFYKLPADEVARSLDLLVASPNVATDRRAVEEGLRALRSGGDFADGAIAYLGSLLGGEHFASFDRDAVDLLRTQGVSAGAPDRYARD